MENTSSKSEQASEDFGPESQETKTLWINYRDADTKPVHHVNQAVMQMYDREIYIAFFQVSPPVVLGTPAEQIRQLENLESLRPDCIARIVVSPRQAKQIIKALQETLDKHEAVQEEEDGITE